MREMADCETVRKFHLENAEMVVTTEEEPDSAHSAICDALSGALLYDYDIRESYTVEAFDSDAVVGEDADWPDRITLYNTTPAGVCVDDVLAMPGGPIPELVDSSLVQGVRTIPVGGDGSE